MGPVVFLVKVSKIVDADVGVVELAERHRRYLLFKLGRAAVRQTARTLRYGNLFHHVGQLQRLPGVANFDQRLWNGFHKYFQANLSSKLW